ncbi:MAG TPA: CBS domain-containing protein [Nitrososphaerales archaeon]|nr:CBS domain-containing protein [Nitrososphaerales archaeon]
MSGPEEAVKGIMEKRVLVVDFNSSAKDCAKAMSKRGVSSAVVVQGGTALGIVTERDLVSKVMADALDASKVLVRDIMSTPLITVAPEATMTKASEVMAQYRIRRLVVIGANGGLAGIITAGDIARVIAEKHGYREVTFNAIARYKEGEEAGPYQ